MYFFLLAACGSPDANTLEAPDVDLAGCAEDDGCTATAAVVSLETGAAEGDWVLSADAWSFDLHLPGHSDLSGLDGQEIAVVVGGRGYGNAADLTVSDATGPAFVLATDAESGSGWTTFGEGFARRGDEVLAESRSGDYRLTHYAAVFTTDDGEVAVGAGEPREIVVGGVSWRVVVHASYTSERRWSLSTPMCMGRPDALSYEALRVEAGADDSLIVRPDGAEIPESGC